MPCRETLETAYLRGGGRCNSGRVSFASVSMGCAADAAARACTAGSAHVVVQVGLRKKSAQKVYGNKCEDMRTLWRTHAPQCLANAECKGAWLMFPHLQGARAGDHDAVVACSCTGAAPLQPQRV